MRSMLSRPMLHARRHIVRSHHRPFHWSYSALSIPTIRPTWLLLEESPNDYRKSGYRPTVVGESLDGGRYGILSKLGHGSQSTAWLARDTENKDTCVAIKIFKSEVSGYVSETTEFPALVRVARGDRHHPGCARVPHLLDTFWVESRYGRHFCTVSETLGPNINHLFNFFFISERLMPPECVIKRVMYDCLLAVDYLHRECNIIHTDIKTMNLLYYLDGPLSPTTACMEDDVTCEVQAADGSTVAITRQFPVVDREIDPADLASWKKVRYTLVDFGSAQLIDEGNVYDHYVNDPISSYMARSPEVYVGAPWNASTDIWSLGTVMLELVNNAGLFPDGLEPKLYPVSLYKMFGRFPLSLASYGTIGRAFFNEEDGDLRATLKQYFGETIDLREHLLGFRDEGYIETSVEAIDFMLGMLVLDPEQRPTAAQLLKHPWFSDVDDDASC